jgi:hypothetical protein
VCFRKPQTAFFTWQAMVYRPRPLGEPRRGNAGATAVEFALLLPLFALLLCGIIDFGRYFFIQHTLQFATREGARLGLVGGILEGSQGSDNAEKRKNSIIGMIQEKASPAVSLSQDSICIFGVTGPDYASPGDCTGQQDAGLPGEYMRVQTRYTFGFLTPLVGNFFSENGVKGTKTIRAEATYRNELF